MPDVGFISIDDPRVSGEIREQVRTQVYQLVASRHNLIVPNDIKWSMSALQRVLYGNNATMAEGIWHASKEKSEHPAGIRIEVHLDNAGFPDKVQHGRRPGKWFRIHELSGGTTYIQVSDDSGRQSQVRPPDLKDENIIDLWAPSGVPITLRNFLDKLISQLDSSSEVDIPFIEAQKNRRPSLLAMYSTDRSFLLNKELVDIFRGILSNLSNYSCEASISKVLSDHKNFLMDGDLGGNILLITSVLEFARMSPQILGSICSSSVAPTASLADILNCITGHKNGSTWIQTTCEGMQKQGEKLQLAALNADSVGGFYGNIYQSIPWLWGAYLGFRYLSVAPKSKEVLSHKIAANVCEERLANATPSLVTAFLDTLDGRALRSSRDLVSRRRRLEGKVAAEALADHFIEVMLEYPRYFKPILLGQKDRYWVRKP